MNVPITICPSIILEFLGFKRVSNSDQDTIEINCKIKNLDSEKEIKNIVIEYFFNKYLNWDELSFDNILNLLKKRKMQLNEHGAKWLDKLNSMYLESDKYRRNFAEYLAYDRLYAYNYPPKIAALIAIRSFLDLYETVKKRRNISVFRGIQLSYESIHNVPLFLNTLSKSYLNISTNDLKKSLGEIINKDRVNSKGDLVDSALVHFATIGFHEDVKSKSVLIFTCDDSSTIKNRVSKYKSAWDFIKKELPKRNLKVPKIKMGAIIFVDDTGKIAEICKVKTLPKDLKLDINSQPKNPAF